MFSFQFFLLLAANFPRLVIAGTQQVWWNITYVEQANPDGLAYRRVVGVNNTWPPPPLDVNTTDSLVLHVTNSLDEPTTLHHHGMFYNRSSWMDGALGVSECGIPPGSTFDYTVPINSSGQRGTYWVHGHAEGHYVDGLRAPLLLHPPEEVYSYDEEFTVILGDWYHEEHKVLLQQFINTSNPDGVEPIPNSGLIYFAQNATYLAPKPGTSSSVASAVGFNENATLPFEPGKTYRLRVINTSAFAMFFFWIDGHQMRIIEVDGIDIEETPVDLLSLTVAQRYSVLVTAHNDTSSNWAIHANMNTEEFDEFPPTLNPNVTSSITYSTSPLTQLTNHDFIAPSYTPIQDHLLVPLVPIPAPSPTRTLTLQVSFDTMTDGTNRGMFNDVTYNSPLVPAVFSEISLGKDNATVEGAYGSSSFVLSYGEVVDLIVVNGDDGMHPFHLHGHTVMLVGRTDSELDKPDSVNMSNPMRRDTVHIPGGGSATLRVVADNPGAWMFHCHMEWHLQAGLAVQFIEAPLELQSQLQTQTQHGSGIPGEMYDNCRALGKPYRGNAAGHRSTTDLSGWEVGPFKRNATTTTTTIATEMGGQMVSMDRLEWEWLEDLETRLEDLDRWLKDLNRQLQGWPEGLNAWVEKQDKQLQDLNGRLQRWSDGVEESFERWLEGYGWTGLEMTRFMLRAVIIFTVIALMVVWRLGRPTVREDEGDESQVLDDLEKMPEELQGAEEKSS